MGKKAPKPPAPPDPAITAAAQSAANKETAITQRDLNLINQITPFGNLTYAYGDDPGTGVRPVTATQTLSPEQQALYQLEIQAQQALGQLANSQLGQARSSLGQPFTIAGALRQYGEMPLQSRIPQNRGAGLVRGVPVRRR